MPFSIVFTTRCKRSVRQLDAKVKTRVYNAISALENTPVPHTAVSLPHEKSFRIRVGEYRILYLVNFSEKEIIVYNIDKRSRVYN